jgi:hypothetical protein
MQANIKNGTLIVEVEVEPYRSASGKSLVIASTHGNVKTGCIYEGKEVTIGLNAYVKQ